MKILDTTTYHIYAKDKVLYCNLDEEEFEEKWELLEVMIDLLGGQYSKDDISYIRLGPKVGVGGPGRVNYNPDIEEHSY